ncbi:MAG: hypothetical protein GF331_04900 [Chitinivibrionales bacterium]|nr:hypothetical protein [Chitinivibrionales bacterium]
MSGQLTVYQDNPRYFAIDGRPEFLTGATPTWTPVSDPDCDFAAENRALVEHGGNFTRILAFFPGHALVPWAVIEGRTAPNGGPVYDLAAWNEAYWDRLRAYLDDCMQRGIVVCLELFDEPSIRYDKGPRVRWDAHPFNPDNNELLTTDDGLPAGRHGPAVRELYDAVRLPHMKRVLQHQRRYVEKLLETTVPYSQAIIYSICNEYTYNEGSADVLDKTHAFAFPRYWADFVHQWGASRGCRLLTAMMPGRAPSPGCYFEDVEFRRYLGSDSFDAIDMAENPAPADAWAGSFDGIANQSGDRLAQVLKRYYGRWTAWQEQAGLVKPLFNSKILCRCVTDRRPPSPEPVWALFFLGAAVSRCHRPHASPEGDIDGQRTTIARLRRFVDKVPFWSMRPHHELVAGDVMCLAEPGEQYALFAPSGGPIAMYLPESRRYEVEWCDVQSGEFITGDATQGAAGGVVIRPPFRGPAAAVVRKVRS